MCEHIIPKLFLNIGFLYFYSNLSPVLQPRLMHLSYRGRGNCNFIKLQKYILNFLTLVFFENLSNLWVFACFCLVLEFAHVFIERRRQNVVWRGYSLSEFDVDSIIIKASWVKEMFYCCRCLQRPARGSNCSFGHYIGICSCRGCIIHSGRCWGSGSRFFGGRGSHKWQQQQRSHTKTFFQPENSLENVIIRNWIRLQIFKTWFWKSEFITNTRRVLI